MRFFQSLTVLCLAALGSTAAIAPSSSDFDLTKKSSRSESDSDSDSNNRGCLGPRGVDKLIAAYVRMLSKWDDADAKYLADSFRDNSDSINILAGVPAGVSIFPTKQAFIDHQHTQPDNLPLSVTSKGPFDCDQISFIWSATFGAAQKPVRGITILGATKAAGFWQIKSIDVEFNNIAYLLNIGGSFKFPGQP